MNSARPPIVGIPCDRRVLGQHAFHIVGEKYIAALRDGKTWYALAANYAFGKSMLDEFTAAIAPFGGKVSKADMYPFPATTDFSSYLLAAKNSGASISSSSWATPASTSSRPKSSSGWSTSWTPPATIPR